MPSKYEVGYRKPPEHSQFKPGQSGNPEGRPKGTKNLKTDLEEELHERILVREGGTERRISKQRALLKSLTAKAIKGDTRAANVLLNMILKVLEAEPEKSDEPQLTADERAVLETLEMRLGRRTSRTRPRLANKQKRRRRPVLKKE